MAAVLISGDLSVCTIDSASYLTLARDAKLAFTTDVEDASPITTMYESAQAVKRSAVLSASIMTDRTSNTQRNTNLEVTLFSAGTQAYIGYVESGTLSIDWTHKDASGPSDAWKFPVCVKKSVRLEGTVFVPATAAAGSQYLPGLAGFTTGDTSAQSMDRLAITAAVTIGGVAISFPATLSRMEHLLSVGDVQKFAFTLDGKANFVAATAMPTGPTGTSTRLEKVFNTTAAYTFTLTNHASEGVAYTGSVLPLSYSVGIGQQGVLVEEHTWASQGAITQTPN